MNIKKLIKQALRDYIYISENMVTDAIETALSKVDFEEKIEEALEEKLNEKLTDIIDEIIDDEIDEAIEEAVEDMLN